MLLRLESPIELESDLFTQLTHSINTKYKKRRYSINAYPKGCGLRHSNILY